MSNSDTEYKIKVRSLMAFLNYVDKDGLYTDGRFYRDMENKLNGIEKYPDLAKEVLGCVSETVKDVSKEPRRMSVADWESILKRSCWVAEKIGTCCHDLAPNALEILSSIEGVVKDKVSSDVYDQQQRVENLEHDPYYVYHHPEEYSEEKYRREANVESAKYKHRDLLLCAQDCKKNIDESIKKYNEEPIHLTKEDAQELQNALMTRKKHVKE